MNGIYYVIKNIETGRSVGPSGVSSAPHLYQTRGKAEGRRKSYYHPDRVKVVPVQLIEIKEEDKS